jgi:hypothetical protein
MFQQNISLFQVFQFIGVILSIIGSAILIARQIKRNLNEYVDHKITVMDTRVKSIEKNIADNEAQNRREHDSIREEVSQKLDLISININTLIQLVKK